MDQTKLFKLVLNGKAILNVPIYANATIGQLINYMNNIILSYKLNPNNYSLAILIDRNTAIPTDEIYFNHSLAGNWNQITDGYLVITVKEAQTQVLSEITEQRQLIDRFQNVPNDVITKMALGMDLTDITNLCQTSTRFNKIICKNNYFWINKLKRDFNIPYLSIGKGDPRYYYEFIRKHSNNWKDSMKEAVSKGDLDLIKFVLSKAVNPYQRKQWMNWNIEYAAEKNHKDVLNYFIQNGVENWDDGLIGATRGNHKDLMKYFSDRGAEGWLSAMYEAVRTGDKNLVIYVINLGGKNFDLETLIYEGLEEAINKNQEGIVKYFIGKYPNVYKQYQGNQGNQRNQQLIGKDIQSLPTIPGL